MQRFLVLRIATHKVLTMQTQRAQAKHPSAEKQVPLEQQGGNNSLPITTHNSSTCCCAVL
jgi:hypothetical protein